MYTFPAAWMHGVDVPPPPVLVVSVGVGAEDPPDAGLVDEPLGVGPAGAVVVPDVVVDDVVLVPGVVAPDAEDPQVVTPVGGTPPGDVSASAIAGAVAMSAPTAAATKAHRGHRCMRDLLLCAARRGRPPECSMSGHCCQAPTP
jgi:hypothetical protein